MKYDYKKTIIKGLIVTAMGAVSALVGYLSGLELNSVGSAFIVISIAALKSLENYLKNRKRLY